MPTLRAGTRELKTLAAIDGTIVARRVAGAEYLELELPRPAEGAEQTLQVHVEGFDHALAVVERSPGTGPVRVLVRDPTPGSVVPAEVRGTLYTLTRDGGTKAAAAPFVAKGPVGKADDKELEGRFFAGLSSSLYDQGEWWLRRPRHPWHSFASARVHPASRGVRVGGPIEPRPTRPSTDFAELMYTTTAATSIQEAL